MNLIPDVFSRADATLVDELSFLVAVAKGTRKVAHRGDWFFLEAQTVCILNGLLQGVAKRLGWQDHTQPHAEAALRDIAARIGVPELPDAILTPCSLRHCADALVALVLSLSNSCTRSLTVTEMPHVDALTRLHSEPDCVSTDRLENDISHIQEVLDLSMEQLRQMPVHVGVVLTGSFASEYRRDQFSDLDLHCICTAVPDNGLRDALIHGMGVRSSCRFGICEYFTCQNVGVEIRFVTERSQREALRRLYEEGRDVPFVDFSHAEQHTEVAVSAHEWATGRILSDSDGTLAAFSEKAETVPAALLRTLHDRWDPIWHTCSAAYLEARKQADALSELTNLHHCTIAASRLLMAHRGLHASAYYLTQIPQLVRHKPEPFRALVGSDLDFLLQPDREGRMQCLTDLWQQIPSQGAGS